MTADEAILSDPDIQAGTPCFRGTRVPIKSLFAAMLHGRNIDEFLTSFPSVQRDQVLAVLHAANELLAHPSPPHPPHPQAA